MIKVRGPMLRTRVEAGVATLHGEVDVSNREFFAAAVMSATRHTDAEPPCGEVHLDLGGIQFIDVGGVRALVTVAVTRQPGHEIVVHRPPALLLRILEIGWGKVRGLKLDASTYASAARNGQGLA